MGIKKFLTGMGLGENERLDLPDDVTTDKALRGLRRQARVQQEELEKVRLKKQIADFNRRRTAEHLFGIKPNNQRMKDEKPLNIFKPQGKQLGKASGLKKGKSMLGKGNFF